MKRLLPACLGDPSYLKPDHFRLKSFSIGRAALKAIERYQGAHGMEALVKGGIHHPWGRVRDEALLTFERITGKKMSPGEIEDWWEVEHEGKRDRPKPVLKFEGNTDQLRCVAVSPDGNLIASGSNDSSAKVWDAHTGKLLHTLRGHGFTVTHVAFHPSGKQLASGSGDLTIKVWDLNTGKGLFTLKGHRHWILQVAYSPDGNRLASASEDCTVRVWDARSAAELLTLRGHRAAVSAVSFSPSGRQLATAGHDGTVRLWDASAGKELHTLEAHAGWVESVAYSPDGKWLATTGVDENTIKLWDVASGKLLRTLKGHTSSVEGTRFVQGAPRDDKQPRLYPGRETARDGKRGQDDPDLGVGEDPRRRTGNGEKMNRSGKGASSLFRCAAPVSRPRGPVRRTRTIGECEWPGCPACSTTGPCGSAAARSAVLRPPESRPPRRGRRGA